MFTHDQVAALLYYTARIAGVEECTVLTERGRGMQFGWFMVEFPQDPVVSLKTPFSSGVTSFSAEHVVLLCNAVRHHVDGELSEEHDTDGADEEPGAQDYHVDMHPDTDAVRERYRNMMRVLDWLPQDLREPRTETEQRARRVAKEWAAAMQKHYMEMNWQALGLLMPPSIVDQMNDVLERTDVRQFVREHARRIARHEMEKATDRGMRDMHARRIAKQWAAVMDPVGAEPPKFGRVTEAEVRKFAREQAVKLDREIMADRERSPLRVPGHTVDAEPIAYMDDDGHLIVPREGLDATLQGIQRCDAGDTRTLPAPWRNPAEEWPEDGERFIAAYQDARTEARTVTQCYAESGVIKNRLGEPVAEVDTYTKYILNGWMPLPAHPFDNDDTAS